MGDRTKAGWLQMQRGKGVASALQAAVMVGKAPRGAGGPWGGSPRGQMMLRLMTQLDFV